MFNLKSCQCSCISISRNHQEQKLVENASRLPAEINDIIKEDISTNNDENTLSENNHILKINDQSNLNRKKRQFIKRWQHR